MTAQVSPDITVNEKDDTDTTTITTITTRTIFAPTKSMKLVRELNTASYDTDTLFFFVFYK